MKLKHLETMFFSNAAEHQNTHIHQLHVTHLGFHLKFFQVSLISLHAIAVFHKFHIVCLLQERVGEHILFQRPPTGKPTSRKRVFFQSINCILHI